MADEVLPVFHDVMLKSGPVAQTVSFTGLPGKTTIICV